MKSRIVILVLMLFLVSAAFTSADLICSVPDYAGGAEWSEMALTFIGEAATSTASESVKVGRMLLNEVPFLYLCSPGIGFSSCPNVLANHYPEFDAYWDNYLEFDLKPQSNQFYSYSHFYLADYDDIISAIGFPSSFPLTAKFSFEAKNDIDSCRADTEITFVDTIEPSIDYLSSMCSSANSASFVLFVSENVVGGSEGDPVWGDPVFRDITVNFGDGTTKKYNSVSDLEFDSHDYGSEGVYTATVTLTDLGGNSDSETTIVKCGDQTVKAVLTAQDEQGNFYSTDPDSQFYAETIRLNADDAAADELVFSIGQSKPHALIRGFELDYDSSSIDLVDVADKTEYNIDFSRYANHDFKRRYTSGGHYYAVLMVEDSYLTPDFASFELIVSGSGSGGEIGGAGSDNDFTPPTHEPQAKSFCVVDEDCGIGSVCYNGKCVSLDLNKHACKESDGYRKFCDESVCIDNPTYNHPDIAATLMASPPRYDTCGCMGGSSFTDDSSKCASFTHVKEFSCGAGSNVDSEVKVCSADKTCIQTVFGGECRPKSSAQVLILQTTHDSPDKMFENTAEHLRKDALARGYAPENIYVRTMSVKQDIVNKINSFSSPLSELIFITHAWISDDPAPANSILDTYGGSLLAGKTNGKTTPDSILRAIHVPGFVKNLKPGIINDKTITTFQACHSGGGKSWSERFASISESELKDRTRNADRSIASIWAKYTDSYALGPPGGTLFLQLDDEKRLVAVDEYYWHYIEGGGVNGKRYSQEGISYFEALKKYALAPREWNIFGPDGKLIPIEQDNVVTMSVNERFDIDIHDSYFTVKYDGSVSPDGKFDILLTYGETVGLCNLGETPGFGCLLDPSNIFDTIVNSPDMSSCGDFTDHLVSAVDADGQFVDVIEHAELIERVENEFFVTMLEQAGYTSSDLTFEDYGHGQITGAVTGLSSLIFSKKKLKLISTVMYGEVGAKSTDVFFSMLNVAKAYASGQDKNQAIYLLKSDMKLFLTCVQKQLTHLDKLEFEKESEWESIGFNSDVQYKHVDYSRSVRAEVVKADLAGAVFDIVRSDEYDGRSAGELVRSNLGMVAAMNGVNYDTSGNPSELVIRNSEIVKDFAGSNEVRDPENSGVIGILNDGSVVGFRGDEYLALPDSEKKKFKFGVQGKLLVHKSLVNPVLAANEMDVNYMTHRSTVCVTAEGELQLINFRASDLTDSTATEALGFIRKLVGVSLFEAAQLLVSDEYGCEYAISLDGGTKSSFGARNKVTISGVSSPTYLVMYEDMDAIAPVYPSAEEFKTALKDADDKMTTLTTVIGNQDANSNLKDVLDSTNNLGDVNIQVLRLQNGLDKFFNDPEYSDYLKRSDVYFNKDLKKYNSYDFYFMHLLSSAQRLMVWMHSDQGEDAFKDQYASDYESVIEDTVLQLRTFINVLYNLLSLTAENCNALKECQDSVFNHGSNDMNIISISSPLLENFDSFDGTILRYFETSSKNPPFNSALVESPIQMKTYILDPLKTADDPTKLKLFRVLNLLFESASVGKYYGPWSVTYERAGRSLTEAILIGLKSENDDVKLSALNLFSTLVSDNPPFKVLLLKGTSSWDISRQYYDILFELAKGDDLRYVDPALDCLEHMLAGVPSSESQDFSPGFQQEVQYPNLDKAYAELINYLEDPDANAAVVEKIAGLFDTLFKHFKTFNGFKYDYMMDSQEEIYINRQEMHRKVISVLTDRLTYEESDFTRNKLAMALLSAGEVDSIFGESINDLMKTKITELLSATSDENIDYYTNFLAPMLSNIPQKSMTEIAGPLFEGIDFELSIETTHPGTHRIFKILKKLAEKMSPKTKVRSKQFYDDIIVQLFDIIKSESVPIEQKRLAFEAVYDAYMSAEGESEGGWSVKIVKLLPFKKQIQEFSQDEVVSHRALHLLEIIDSYEQELKSDDFNAAYITRQDIAEAMAIVFSEGLFFRGEHNSDVEPTESQKQIAMLMANWARNRALSRVWPNSLHEVGDKRHIFGYYQSKVIPIFVAYGILTEEDLKSKKVLWSYVKTTYVYTHVISGLRTIDFESKWYKGIEDAVIYGLTHEYDQLPGIKCFKPPVYFGEDLVRPRDKCTAKIVSNKLLNRACEGPGEGGTFKSEVYGDFHFLAEFPGRINAFDTGKLKDLRASYCLPCPKTNADYFDGRPYVTWKLNTPIDEWIYKSDHNDDLLKCWNLGKPEYSRFIKRTEVRGG